ncbi:hypothetical protein AB8U03_10820 [Clostridium sp. Mt-5]|uniref:Uncharacterized protein n=1 Tax=Clostridium moutaii TaxID=3240932 RepID=A0ABV4BQ71_9CLOT
MEKKKYPKTCDVCKLSAIMEREKIITNMCCYGCPNRERINKRTQKYCEEIS